jgi:hypothetical protein
VQRGHSDGAADDGEGESGGGKEKLFHEMPLSTLSRSTLIVIAHWYNAPVTDLASEMRNRLNWVASCRSRFAWPAVPMVDLLAAKK